MLLKAPESWPHPVAAATAMILLAALDIGGAFAAKEAVVRSSLAFGALGAALFLTLFWVYASSLQYAELAPVTLGWVVMLQVGVVILDRVRYENHIPVGAWAAIVVILVAQTYLVVVTQSPRADDAGVADAPPAVTGTPAVHPTATES